MVPNPLSTNDDDDDEKPAKVEAETSHEIVGVHYMVPNIGSNIGSNTNSKQCDGLDKSQSKVRYVYVAINTAIYVCT